MKTLQLITSHPIALIAFPGKFCDTKSVSTCFSVYML